MDFQVKGSILIQVRDADSLELKREVTGDNIIVDSSFLTMIPGSGVNIFTSFSRICISTNTATPSRSVSTLTNVIAVSYVPPGVNSPVWYHTASPVYGQIQGRIDQVGTSRTFQTIGLTNAASTNSTNTSASIATYLRLNAPCTQGANEILDLFYRISFVAGSNSGFQNPEAIADFGGSTFGLRTFKAFQLNISALGLPPSNYVAPWCSTSQDTLTQTISDYVTATQSSALVNSTFKRRMVLDYGAANEVGRIYNTMFHGLKTNTNLTNQVGVDIATEAPYGWNRFGPQSNSPTVQTTFTHSATATLPFYDSLRLASGTGRVLFSIGSGGWANKFPEMYRVTITGSGATGVSTYKFAVRNHFGFNGNAWSDRNAVCCYRNQLVPAYPKAHGFRVENDLVRWSNSQIVQYDANGVNLLDLFDGTVSIWDSTTTPALPATAIGQVAADPANNKIYVGCRNTGLYVIDVLANTVTQVSTNKCYGVDVGLSSRAYAVLENRLANSTDWTTALTLTGGSGITTDWSKVSYIKVDPEHVNNRVCIVVSTTGTGAQLYWWNQANSTVVLGPALSANVTINPGHLDVSDTGGHWAHSQARLTFNSATTSSANCPNTNSGAFSYLSKVTFIGPNLIEFNRVTNSAGTIIKTASFSGICLYLGNNVVYSTTQTLGLSILYKDNSEDFVWQNYGWNGSAWVLNHSGSKPTHSTSQPLINGIEVRFQDGTAAPHFVNTDWYNTNINYGVLKDNLSTLYYAFGIYTKTAMFNTALPSGGSSLTVPVSAPYEISVPVSPTGNNPDPDFIRLDTDAPYLTQITLNGTSVTTTFFNNENPGVNEVTVDGATGKLRFNAADVGKTIGGVYTYIKH